MTHQEDGFQRVPAHVRVARPIADDAGTRSIQLLVHGQGTIGLTNEGGGNFTVLITDPSGGSGAFQWSVEAAQVSLTQRDGSGWDPVLSVEGAGLDADPKCEYWFSFDCHNRALLYGKGEMRLGTRLAQYRLEAPPPIPTPDPYGWLAMLDVVQVAGTVDGPVDLWRDPVTVEPPLRVVATDQVTMVDTATGAVTVAANLTPACQTLYANVAGANFTLNTPDFPNFSDAITASINDPAGWCYQKLAEKAHEFGPDDPQMTYLRITMGQNQGESPGIPFVMEIWPSGHYSPIHNHGGADAVIKVLHGAIHVSLFRMLSAVHVDPFAQTDFNVNDVTWISARLNQVHQLQNTAPAEPCITVQCYLYDETNLTHYPYFDYLANSVIGQFTPNSDMDYLAFKEQMQKEWGERGSASPVATPAVEQPASPKPLVVHAEHIGISERLLRAAER